MSRLRMSRITIFVVQVCLAAAAPMGCTAGTLGSTDELSSTDYPLSGSSAVDRAEIAYRWAPVHYMDVDPTGSHALGGRSDYLARYDFDGDLNGRNNWDHTDSGSLAAYVYYSVVETGSHWYIVYMFFHPRDWTDIPFDQEHENDAEGVLMVVQRDGSAFGTLRAAVTVAHNDFYSFTPSGSTWGSGREDIDGTLQMVSYDGVAHPVTAQESKGHGLKARPYYDIQGGDGIVYYPSRTRAEVPSGPNDRNVAYRLIDINTPGGLWDQRNNSSLFASFGTFAGDTGGGCGSGWPTCAANKANAPWGWDDHDDVPGRGAMASDPAMLAVSYFSIPESVSRTYVWNPFR